MKRRKFLKGLASGTVAGIAAPRHLAEGQVTRETSAPHTAGKAAPRELASSPQRYTASDRVRSGMALGGIGAGTFELRKNGCFYNWNIFNNFPKETGPEFKLPEGEIEDPQEANLFFLVRFQVEDEAPKIKLLQLPDGLYEGAEMGIAFTFPWMQPVDRIEYTASYPFSTFVFSAEDMPFTVTMQAWTPFIPHDVKNSSLPLAYFDFSIEPAGPKPCDVMLIMTGQNNVGYDTPDRFYTTEIKQDGRSKTVSMSAGGMDERASTWGQIALCSLHPDSTHYAGWAHRHPYLEYVLRHAELPDLDDTKGTDSIQGPVPDWMPRTKGRNRIDEKSGRLKISDGRILSSVARSFKLRAGASVIHSFAYTWNFPNLYAEKTFRQMGSEIEGHFYSNFFPTAAAVAEYATVERDDLHRRSRKFLDDFFDSSADVFVLEQVNSQLNTFATNGRLVKSGEFGVLEGLSSTWSWGPIGTIDVMLYGTVPIIALFPELQKSTVRAHMRAQSPEGEIAHGLQKGFHTSEDGTAGVSHRLDLPGQYVLLVIRDFLWTDDLDYLREMYPSIQKAIEYIERNRSFPGSSVPLMKGIECSYDNFPMYGYASYILSQWIAATLCAARAAEALGDTAAAARYTRIASETRTAINSNLWNGNYYSLYNDLGRAAGHGDRSEGCLTDQLVGQWSAHQVGIGYILDREKVQSSLKAVLAQSYAPDFGLRNCSWPGAKFFADVDRDIWGDQGNTCWSGVELAFASFLLYEGMHSEALAVIRTVDDRYRKNGLYFDHQEFGGHYFRPMAAWGILNGLLGLAVNRKHLSFDPRIPATSYKLFFATSTATARFSRESGVITLACLSGSLSFAMLSITGKSDGTPTRGGSALPANRTHQELDGRSVTTWTFSEQIALDAGESIEFSV